MRKDYRPGNARRATGGRSTSAYQKYLRNRKRLFMSDGDLICHLCGGVIDRSLTYPHPGAFTADHIVPLSQGGFVDGDILPAHNSCNASRKDKPLARTAKSAGNW